MKVVLEPNESGNAIATIAIGAEYYDNWRTYALPSWKDYCQRNRLGLIVFDRDLIPKSHRKWKKATWQKMLIGDAILKSGLGVQNICYLDTDFLINHHAPNIFDEYDPQSIALVSQIESLPYDRMAILRRVAFFRHTCYDTTYPLDSALFMSPRQLFEYHHLTPKDNYACMGLFIFNIENHSEIMKSWFNKYERDVESITGGGDEAHINFQMQDWGNITWLDYRFHALWIYEMAWKYPFLYDYGRNKEDLIRECIEAALYSNYFLHFAGSWFESDMWKTSDIFRSDSKRQRLSDYFGYLQQPVYGEPKGMKKPKC